MRVISLTALLVALFGAIPVARADLIFLKDGYVIQGNVKREGVTEFDQTSKDFTWMPKGFFLIDDGPRRIYFSPTQVAIVERLPAQPMERIVRTDPHFILKPLQMPVIEEVLDARPWDFKKWEREFFFRSPDSARIGCKQKLAELTPYFARVDAITKYKWSSGYLIRELDPETIYTLLRNHPQLQDDYMPPPPPVPKRKAPLDKAKDDKPKEDVKPKEPEKPAEPRKPTQAMIVRSRMHISDFLAQAGWFDLAEKELDRLLKDFPDQKKRVDDGRALIAKLRAREEWEQIKKWYNGGRHTAVTKRLNSFVTAQTPDRIQADVREMLSKISHGETMMTESSKALKKCVDDATSPAGKALASAVTEMLKELHPATVGRLDAFLGQYREAVRQRERNKTPPYTPEQLLALAVTGWLLGSPSADPKPETAINLWKTRQMILQVCREDDAVTRKRILAAYEKDVTPRVELDEVTQLIASLPPVDPGPISTEVTQTRVGRGRNLTTVHLALPPEYAHGRSYPVLIVLPEAGEGAAKALERWKKPAADQGYILAAPEWLRGLNNKYGYTEQEHDAVLDTLRDLRKRYQIDSDRVFLFGLGEGGKMAFDVGLSHPDLFAGVMPMGAAPHYFPRRYWRNAQYLPMYVVNGTRAGPGDTLRDVFTNWVQRGYPTLWVEYKGRGIEFLGGEVENIFDWMRNQRRAFPLRQVGTDGNGSAFGNEFCTMRVEDNRFYWLSTTDISARHIATASQWNNLTNMAYMTGRIDPTTNEITLRTLGLGQITVWLGRNPKGEYMVDFDKPIMVRVGLRSVFNRKVTPGLEVLLEDLYKRGDRRHLYVAKIDVSLR